MENEEFAVSGQGKASPLDAFADTKFDPRRDKNDDVEMSVPEEIMDAVEFADKHNLTTGSMTLKDGRHVSFSIDPIKEETEDIQLSEPEDEPPSDIKTGPEVKEDPAPSEAQKPEFDPNSIQDPLRSSNGPEGGVTRNATKGPSGSSVGAKSAGGTLKLSADLVADSVVGKFEMSGFEAEYDAEGQTHRVHIRDYYDDLETAKMTVTGNQYLMPMPNGTMKRATVYGVPTISLNDREVVSIKNGGWERR